MPDQMPPTPPADQTPAVEPALSPVSDPLRRPMPNPMRGLALLVVVTALVAFLIRITRLDAYLLTAREGHWASNAWSIYTGRPLPASQELPNYAPLYQLSNAVSFFLFGVNDVIARFTSVFFGCGLVVLMVLLRPFVSRSHVAAMAILAALSPTLVYASRIVEPGIMVAFFSLLMVIAVLRTSISTTNSSRAGWALVAGIGLGATYASGPQGVSTILSVLFAGALTMIIESPRNRPDAQPATAHLTNGLRLLIRSRESLIAFATGLIVTLGVTFTRLLIDFGGVVGLVDTVTEWGHVLATRATPLSSFVFIWALLLYEILPIIFSLFAGGTPRGDDADHPQELNPTFFLVWFVAALILATVASGREATMMTTIVVPLIILGGIGLGNLLDRLARHDLWTQPNAATAWAAGGVVALVAAVLVSVLQQAGLVTGDIPGSGWVVVILALIGVALLLIGSVITLGAGTGRQAVPVLGLAVASLLIVFTAHTSAGLAYVHGDEGRELLAQNVPNDRSRILINQVNQLSRDLSVNQKTVIDPTGRYGLRIALDPSVQWPFTWYFRNYNDLSIVEPAGLAGGFDVVIGPGQDTINVQGLTPRTREWITQPPTSLTQASIGDALGSLAHPGSALDFLLHRTMTAAQQPTSITIGYSDRVNNQLNPNFGPFDLFGPQTPGPGSGQGQLFAPTGIAYSANGQTIYVVNAGNQRIDRYDASGVFLSVWDRNVNPQLLLSSAAGQGATGITTMPNGTMYVADTWNHRVIQLDAQGQVVREFGIPGQLTDIGNGNDIRQNTGAFYGPRAVAATDELVFVTDTGNERVQIFKTDATFVGVFGGFGSAEGQFIEPTGIAIGPDGNVYVADSGNARIQVFTQDGTFLRAYPIQNWVGEQGTQRLNFIGFTADGVLIMTSPLTQTVDAFNGTSTVSLTPAISGMIGGFAISPDGQTLLASDTQNSTVRRLALNLPDGFGSLATPPVPATPSVATPAVETPVATPMASPEVSPDATPATRP